jgi:hypothetical protein
MTVSQRGFLAAARRIAATGTSRSAAPPMSKAGTRTEAIISQ